LKQAGTYIIVLPPQRRLKMQQPSELRHTAFDQGSVPLMFRSDPVRREGGRRRILVVEDDVALADQVCEAIAAMGLEPLGPTGALGAGLAFAETQELHGALLDVRLQRGLRVYPVAEVLWRRRIPFCFMTAYCDQQMTAYPAEAILYKPISLSALRPAIRMLIDA
jgi:CheY-like chemotaxis protein